jgi:ribokinase
MSAETQPDPVDVVFIGRANIDLTVHIPYRPGPGQTAVGSELVPAPGGKSLNQAVAVARLGGRPCLVANVGADHWGHHLKTTLAESGVDTTYFQYLPGVRTGAAIIEITPDGENFLILAVSPATELTAEQVDHALTQIDAPVTTIQLDLPPEPLTQAVTAARSRVLVGNLVPHPAFDRQLMARLDVLVVNQHEAATILGVENVDPLAAAQQLRQLGPAAAVVTAGPKGAAYSYRDRADTIGAATVPVVDTTGAGDAFLGCLALDLSRDIPLPDAVARAVRIGTNKVQHKGALLPPETDSEDAALRL